LKECRRLLPGNSQPLDLNHSNDSGLIASHDSFASMTPFNGHLCLSPQQHRRDDGGCLAAGS
ncbi:hypothetical protein, partial [Oculatella sp. FACHB-28]|uniref:hypothetical protein n=1 Tax=Oculatella sp. FACHB-28 TaxID=2692845 RepID=UPI001A7EE98D